ncbi:LysR family transcriptional regulator [Variovorax dokdonensis]|uniref:LysR family transcriptional regulator n=1 Tax=Variovorax dokdonensis TaxID=344883 RepID=A0ABT7NE08_9BURK|nr:LysR family transcriptional regulator [Variovorax dokdonensis]MDM0046173.1 LysR family transcriptional regulator [Variovorax dokdonensis]
MHIHSRSVVYFDMIRRVGSIRGAAKHLHVTASAINRQLLQLEQEVGTPLFERLPSGLQLTSAGESFARHVITVLQDSHRLANDLDALRGIRRGSVHLMTAEGLMPNMVSTLVGRMLAKYPMVDITVGAGDAERMASAVANGEADVAIGFALRRRTDLRQVGVGRYAFGAVVSPDHALANQAQVTLADCAKYPLILANEQLSTYAVLEPILRNFKRPYKVALRTGSIELMKVLAATGAGVAFQTRIGMDADLAQKKLVFLPLRAPGKLYSEVGIYVRAGRSLPPAVDAFLRFADEELERQSSLE